MPGSDARRAIALAALIAALVVVESVCDRPPAPRDDHAPADAFSEGRARPFERALAALGPHPLGSPAHAQALALLRTALAKLPGIEVEVQEVDAARASRENGALVAHVHNLVARLPGATAEAILLVAHYDSAPEAPGAADDGAAAASLVEVLRALAAGPTLPCSVVMAWTDAEEDGLIGASGLLQHRLAHGVRAFVNVDAAGAAGKALLYRATPGAGFVLDAYASVPHPFANVIGQDLMAHGLVPSDTDFHVLADAGLPGIDLAFFEDGWAYHTSLDDDARLQRGSLQHLGDDLLALVRTLAAGQAKQGGGTLYFDVLGVALVRIPARLAAVIGWVIVALALAVVSWRRRSWAELVRRTLLAALALITGLALPLVAAAVVGYALHRAMGWYATPSLAVVAYAPLAAAGAWFVIGRRATHDDASGVVLVLTALLAAALAAHLGCAYLVAVWCVAAAIALALRGRGAWALFVLPLAMAVQAVAMLVRLYAPLAGRLRLGAGSEIAMAAIISLIVAVAALPLAGLAPRRAALALLALGMVALGASALRPIGAPDRPRRVHVAAVARDGKTELHVDAEDGLPIAHAQPSLVVAATPSLTARALGGDGITRRVELTLRGGRTAWARLPAGVVHGWSLPLPAPDSEHAVSVEVVGADQDSAPRVELTLPAAPVEVRIGAEAACSDAELAALRAAMPAAAISCATWSSQKTTL